MSISERTKAALQAARMRGTVLRREKGLLVIKGADAPAAVQARRLAAERAAHRLALEVERLRAEGVDGYAALALSLTEYGVATPRGRDAWTHTTVARVLARAEA